MVPERPVPLRLFVLHPVARQSSEAVMVALTLTGKHDPLALWAVATVGNTLGGLTSWAIGRLLAHRYPAEGLTKKSSSKINGLAVDRLRRYGSPVLLLSWVPFIGDPLCVAAGWIGVRFWSAVVFMGLGKGLRYGVLVWFL